MCGVKWGRKQGWWEVGSKQGGSKALTIEPVPAWGQGVALTEVHHPHAVPVVVVVCIWGLGGV